MDLVLKRQSLVEQVTDVVREQILRGAWPDWVPSEREFSRMLHVSRNTCRTAMQALQHEKLIEPHLGRGTRVNLSGVKQVRNAGMHTRSVGAIIPRFVTGLRPSASLVLDDLREQLFDLNVRLFLHQRPSFKQANCGPALQILVDKYHHDCWILLNSPQQMQTWFCEQGLACMISGSAYAGVGLPSVDFDFRAICRHAVGRLAAAGHRRIAFLNRQLKAAGDIESEIGFQDGLRAVGNAAVDGRIFYHDDDRESVSRIIARLFSSGYSPSAILVAHTYCYLAVVTALAKRGLRVPQDVSLISREDDPFLRYLEPEPARYLNETAAMTNKIMQMLRGLLQGEPPKSEVIRILPRFVTGHSLRVLR